MKKYQILALIIFVIFEIVAFASAAEKSIENALLQSDKDKAERQGNKLILKVHGKVSKIYTDTAPEAEADTAHYQLVEVEKNSHTLLIEVTGYEGGPTYEIFNYENGKAIRLDGKPIWNNSHKDFAILNDEGCDECCYDAKACDIWELTSSGFKKVIEKKVCGTKAKWASERKICMTFTESDIGPSANEKYINCEKSNSVWNCVETKACP